MNSGIPNAEIEALAQRAVACSACFEERSAALSVKVARSVSAAPTTSSPNPGVGPKEKTGRELGMPIPSEKEWLSLVG